jgi:hypothetical protein
VASILHRPARLDWRGSPRALLIAFWGGGGGERLEAFGDGGKREVAIEGRELRAAFVYLARCERRGELNGVIGTETVDAGELGSVLQDAVADLEREEARRAVSGAGVVGDECANEEERIVQIELTCAVLSPDRRDDLDARQCRDDERAGQPPDRLMPVLVGVELDQRGGVGEDAQPRSSATIDASDRPRPARLRARVSAASSGAGWGACGTTASRPALLRRSRSCAAWSPASSGSTAALKTAWA